MCHHRPQPSPGSAARGAGTTLPARRDPLLAPTGREHAEQRLPPSITLPELSAKDVTAGGRL